MTTQTKSGELTLKQAGIMLTGIGGGILAIELATGRHWEWRGVPVLYIAVPFLILGILLAIIRFVNKS